MSESVISLADIVHILNPMVDKYFELGVQLGVDVACLKQIEGEYSSHLRRLYEIIHFWQNNKTSTCGWSTLANAVAKIRGHENLVRELRARDLNTKEPSSCDESATESSDGSFKSIEESKDFMKIPKYTGHPPRLVKRQSCDSLEIPEDTGYSTKSDSPSDESSSGSDTEHFDLVPGCGCKDKPCSICTLCAGGCPNPTSKRVHMLRKQSCTTKVVLPLEEEEDYEDYEHETKNIQKSFGRFVMDTCNSFKKLEGVNAQNLALFIRGSFPIMKPRTDELTKAESLEQIFYTVVDQACSWFDYEIIKDMINYYGHSNDKSRLEKYEEEFKKYARERLPKGKKHIEVGNGARKGCKQLVIKIDKEWEDINFSDLDKLCGSFASILHVRRRDLYLADIREGCIMMTLMIPEEIAIMVFPTKRCLTLSQIQSFKDRGVISLKCGKFCWRAAASVPSVGEPKDKEGSLTSLQNIQPLKNELRYEKPPQQAANRKGIHHFRVEDKNKVSKGGYRRLRHLDIGFHQLIILMLLGLWSLALFAGFFSQHVHIVQEHCDSTSTFPHSTATFIITEAISTSHPHMKWWNQSSYASRMLFEKAVVTCPVSYSGNPYLRIKTIPSNWLPLKINVLYSPKGLSRHLNADFGHVVNICTNLQVRFQLLQYIEGYYPCGAKSYDVVDLPVKSTAPLLPSIYSLVRETTATSTTNVFNYCDLTSVTSVLTSNLNSRWDQNLTLTIIDNRRFNSTSHYHTTTFGMSVLMSDLNSCWNQLRSRFQSRIFLWARLRVNNCSWLSVERVETPDLGEYQEVDRILCCFFNKSHYIGTISISVPNTIRLKIGSVNVIQLKCGPLPSQLQHHAIQLFESHTHNNTGSNSNVLGMENRCPWGSKPRGSSSSSTFTSRREPTKTYKNVFFTMIVQCHVVL